MHIWFPRAASMPILVPSGWYSSAWWAGNHLTILPSSFNVIGKDRASQLGTSTSPCVLTGTPCDCRLYDYLYSWYRLMKREKYQKNLPMRVLQEFMLHRLCCITCAFNTNKRGRNLITHQYSYIFTQLRHIQLTDWRMKYHVTVQLFCLWCSFRTRSIQ